MFESVGLKAMVIDDHRVMRQIVRRLLHQNGIEDVAEAEDGAEALAAIAKPNAQAIDFALCDLHMAPMDGLTFCNALRRDERYRSLHIPVLLLTGESDEFLLDVARQAGAAAVLRKPISAPNLGRAIASAIGFDLAAAAPAAPAARPSAAAALSGGR